MSSTPTKNNKQDHDVNLNNTSPVSSRGVPPQSNYNPPMNGQGPKHKQYYNNSNNSNQAPPQQQQPPLHYQQYPPRQHNQNIPPHLQQNQGPLQQSPQQQHRGPKGQHHQSNQGGNTQQQPPLQQPSPQPPLQQPSPQQSPNSIPPQLVSPQGTNQPLQKPIATNPSSIPRTVSAPPSLQQQNEQHKGNYNPPAKSQQVMMPQFTHSNMGPRGRGSGYHVPPEQMYNPYGYPPGPYGFHPPPQMYDPHYPPYSMGPYGVGPQQPPIQIQQQQKKIIPIFDDKGVQINSTSPTKDTTPVTTPSKDTSSSSSTTTSSAPTPAATPLSSSSTPSTPPTSTPTATSTTPAATATTSAPTPATTPTTPTSFSGYAMAKKKEKERLEKERLEKERLEKEKAEQQSQTQKVEEPVKPAVVEEVKPVVESKPQEVVATSEIESKPTPAPVAEPPQPIETPEDKKETTPATTKVDEKEEGEIVVDTAASTTNAVVEEEEEWEKNKDDKDQNMNNSNNNNSNNNDSINNVILNSSGTNPFALRSSSGVIRYSHDEMWKLRPQHIDPKPELKDLGVERGGDQLKNSRDKNPMNKSGSNLNMYQQPGKMMAKQPFNKLNSSGNFQNKYSSYQQSIQQQIQQGPQQHQPPVISQPANPLPVNENRWVPTKLSNLSDIQIRLRKTKFILNRISPEKFDQLSKDLLDIGFTKQNEVFTGVIQQIFEKAISEAKYVTMYSNLCKKIFMYEKDEKEADKKAKLEIVEQGEKDGNVPPYTREQIEKESKPMFRNLLLSTCQEEYEKVTKQFDTIDVIPPDLTPQEKTDYEEQQFIQRKKFFGLIKFIAELFKQDMLSEKIIHHILVALMGELVKPQEIKLECFCKLLTTIGAKIDSRKDPSVDKFMNGYYQRMDQLINSSNLSQRIKFLIQNVLDLKNNGWKVKEDQAPKPQKEERNVEEERRSAMGINVGKGNMFAAPMNFNTKPMVKTGSGSPSMSMMMNTPPMNKPGGNIPPSFAKNPPGLPMSMMTKKPPGMSGSPISSNMMMNQPPRNSVGGNNYSPNQSKSNTSTTSTTTTSSSSSTSSSQLAAEWEKISIQMKDSLEEFLEHNDEFECIECINEYVKSADHYPSVVSLVIEIAIEQPERVSRKLTSLLDTLAKEKVFTGAQIVSGFDKFISKLQDVLEDRPNAFGPIAKICFALYNQKQLSLSNISSSLTQQVENVGSAVSKILVKFIEEFEEPEQAAKAFREANIDIATFFTSPSDRRNIIEVFNQSNLSSFLDELKFK